MNAISSLEAQHCALESIMLRLVNLVQGFHGPDQALPITVQLAKLAHLLRLHLATEDEWFYPAMIHSDGPLVAAVATAYRDEVGGIAEDVETFLTQWNSSTVIGLGFDRAVSRRIILPVPQARGSDQPGGYGIISARAVARDRNPAVGRLKIDSSRGFPARRQLRRPVRR